MMAGAPLQPILPMAPEGLGEGVPSTVPLPTHPHVLPVQGEKPS